MTSTPGPLLLTISAGTLAAVGAVDPSTAEPALQLGGLGVGMALGWRALDLGSRVVAALETLVREGITVRHDHGGAVAAVSGLAVAVDRHAEATVEVEHVPSVRTRRVG